MTTLDSKQYKEAERQSWNSVAAGWQKWWKPIEMGAEKVSRRLTERAEIKSGSTVLDIATGIGELAVTAAKQVGSSGHVLGNITTPTVKARFQRLVNIGFINSVSPIFDFGVVEEAVLDNGDQNKNTEHNNPKYLQQLGDVRSKIKKGIKIKLDCGFCQGPIVGHPLVFKFANYERFFCCAVCMSSYKQKYAGRIESIIRKFEGKDEY
jgi:Lrp/AsnC family leucine-responsive transcriptional regulator